MLLLKLLLLSCFCGATNTSLLTLDKWGSTYEVTSTFWLPFSQIQVWDVLTDYNHFSKFMQFVATSQVQKVDSCTIVDQQIKSRVGIFHRTLHLRLCVSEFPFNFIKFEDIAHKGTLSYTGSWTLQSVSCGTQVVYHLLVTPKHSIPYFILAPTLRAAALAVQRDILTEITKRTRS